MGSSTATDTISIFCISFTLVIILHRYVDEFEGRHNDRPSDTIKQMAHMVQGMEGKRLRYSDLIAGGPAYPPIDDVQF